jgi:serine/threonine protein kinase
MTAERNEHDADLAGFAVSSGADRDQGRDDVERLATALTEQVRAGLPTDVERVAEGSLELATKLRQIAPVIEALERWKTLKEAECGAGELPATLSVDRLGDCRLGREIGRGGNAIVFAAVQGLVWRRRVAVKVFPWRRATDGGEGRQRFLEEASTLARLQHRHIVPIYSFGSENGCSYYVMRLAEGGSLDRLIGRLRSPATFLAGSGRTETAPRLGRTDWRAMAVSGVQVAEALAYAHSQGVVHGDIKPANVLLDAGGRALVTDFGPAEQALPDERVRLAGTYRYMAPERFDGTCDALGDVYSLGVTLYELVTLTPAFEGEGRDSLVNNILRHHVVGPRLVRPDIPEPLAAVVAKAMAREPAARYASAEALAADLQNFLRGRRLDASPRGGGSGIYRRWFGGSGATRP